MSQRPMVLKLGGRVLDHDAACAEIASVLASVLASGSSSGKTSGIAAPKPPVVVVHGGGVRVDALLGELKIESPKINGLRATNDQAIGPVAGVLAGVVNKRLVGVLRSHGCNALGLCLGDGGALRVERAADPALGNVGRVIGGEARLWRELLGSGYTPVVSSIGLGPQGELLNVNADDAAAGVAAALEARTLVMVTDTEGVLDARQQVIPELDAATMRGLIADGSIAGGMIPKVNAAQRAADILAAPVTIMHWNQLAGSLQASASKIVGTRVLPASLGRVRPRGGPELATTESA